MSRYIILALGLCLIYNVAIAASASFSALDTNADGLITAGEAQADPSLVAVFGELDVNGDGFLSQAEYSAVESSKEG